MTLPSGLARTLLRVRERGLAYALRAGLHELSEPIRSSYAFYRVFNSLRTFSFEGRRYRYFYHRYNTTWRNERAVEIPIVWEIVRARRGQRMLEIGNVLSHYFRVDHDRVDKYEKAAGVINEDVADYRPERRYDLIVSVSTLEHVGWDEEPRDPDKILRAVRNLEGMLAPRGSIVLTLPLAYNPHLDVLLREGKLPLSRRGCLKRVSHDNRWKEVAWEEIQDARFDTPYRRINALVIGVIEAGAGAAPT